MNNGVAALTACPNGHEITYPARLEQAAMDLDTELAFYAACPCGGAIVVAWAGDRIRVMAHGEAWLAEELEVMDWPEVDLGDPQIGPFTVYKMPSLEWNLLSRQIEERHADETGGTP